MEGAGLIRFAGPMVAPLCRTAWPHFRKGNSASQSILAGMGSMVVAGAEKAVDGESRLQRRNRRRNRR
jgi:hypothetical protein